MDNDNLKQLSLGALRIAFLRQTFELHTVSVKSNCTLWINFEQSPNLTYTNLRRAPEKIWHFEIVRIFFYFNFKNWQWPYRTASCTFDYVMIFSKVVAHEPGKVSKLVLLISDRWSQWNLLKMHQIVNCEFDHVLIGQISDILGFIIYDFSNYISYVI